MPEFPGSPIRRTAAIVALAGLIGLPATLSSAIAAPDSPTCGIPERVLAAPAAATPAARSAATPVPTSDAPISDSATPVAAAPKIDPAAAEVDAVARALAACLTDGDAEGVADLATDRWLGAWFGGESMSREQFMALATGLGWMPVEIREVGDVKVKGDGATADIEYVIGHQLSRSRWSFVQAPVAGASSKETRWRVEGEEPLDVKLPRGAKAIDVTLGENVMSLSTETIDGETIVLRGGNGGATDHEMLVLRFDEGFTLANLLRSSGPGLPEQVEWIGQATIPAGTDADLILTDLEPGLYWVVCLFPNPDGSLHAGYEEAAAFTVK